MWDIQTLGQAGSSQDEAKKRPVHGACVRVLQQIGGRGRHGRVWESLPGNLFFSFVLEPERVQAEWGSLSLLAGLALHEAVDYPAAVLKWPNDLMLDDRKCAGILVEVEDAAVIVGIGVNVVSAPDGFSELGDGYAADDVLARFLTCFEVLYQRWQAGGFAEVKDDWLVRSYAMEAPMSVKLPQGAVQGEFAGVSDEGALLLREENGAIRTITTGDIIYATGH